MSKNNEVYFFFNLTRYFQNYMNVWNIITSPYYIFYPGNMEIFELKLKRYKKKVSFWNNFVFCKIRRNLQDNKKPFILMLRYQCPKCIFW